MHNASNKANAKQAEHKKETHLKVKVEIHYRDFRGNG